MLLGRDVAEHRRAEPADHGGADARGDVVVARRDVGDERPERIERRLAAFAQLLVHVGLDLVHGHVARALDHDLAALVPGDLGELAQGLELGELRGIVGVGVAAGPQAVAQRERHVVLAHDVANVAEVLVEEALAMLGQAPLRHHRAAAAHDAGDALGRQRHMGQPHAGMDGEVVDALLALLDQRVAIDLPRELGGIAADLLQRLVDRHGADRHRRIAHDPFARVVDVAAGRQVHDRVGAPADRPHHLLDLFLHRGGDRRVADVGVDLHQEIAADRHRLELAVVDVGRDDGAAHRHFLAHELGRDELGQRGAEALAVGQPFLGEIERHLAAEILALGDVDHFLGDDARARPFELGDRLA